MAGIMKIKKPKIIKPKRISISSSKIGTGKGFKVPMPKKYKG